MTITAPSRSLEGTLTGDSQLMERVRFLRAGLVTPLPGGPGITSSGRSLRNCYAPPAQ
jgi:hypothetical protein